METPLDTSPAKFSSTIPVLHIDPLIPPGDLVMPPTISPLPATFLLAQPVCVHLSLGPHAIAPKGSSRGKAHWPPTPRSGQGLVLTPVFRHPDFCSVAPSPAPPQVSGRDQASFHWGCQSGLLSAPILPNCLSRRFGVQITTIPSAPQLMRRQRITHPTGFFGVCWHLHSF